MRRREFIVGLGGAAAAPCWRARCLSGISALNPAACGVVSSQTAGSRSMGNNVIGRRTFLTGAGARLW
jgi:hypothetical protein